MSLQKENSVSKIINIPDKQPNWWEVFVKEEYPNQKCLQYFKCSRKTYLFLIKALKPYIAPRNFNISHEDSPLFCRRGVCVEKQVAVVLYKLTASPDYLTLSKKFKLHKTTIHKIIYKSVVALNKYYLHSIVSMPKPEEAKMIARNFEQGHKLPQIIGALTIVHIPIASPINLNYKFLNPKLYTSFILQSVIDSNCFFRDVSVRHAGAAEPHLILADSNLYKYSQKVLPSEKRNINGIEISYKIVGPAEGPFNSWLLNDYSLATTPEDILFNKCLEEIRNYADSVIARLRSRFLILSQMMDLNYKVAPQIIAACCIIHNICEREGDPFLEEWLVECAELLKKYPQPEIKEDWEEADKEMLDERNKLRDYIHNDHSTDFADILEDFTESELEEEWEQTEEETLKTSDLLRNYFSSFSGD